MNTPRPAILLIAFSVFALQAGPEHLIKQRAKDVRDQNNERQGVTPAVPGGGPAPSAPPAQPATVPYAARPATPALTPQVARIAESLEAVSRSGDVTDAQKEQLTGSLTAAASGSVKPAESKIRKLAKDLAIAVEATDLSSSQRSKLAGQIDRALNESLSAKEMETLAAEVQDTLRQFGVGKVDAAIVGNDLKSIIAEIQKGARN